ncbi:MAG: hypothetical protein AAB397_02310 [Patescibacteria group bacterium]
MGSKNLKKSLKIILRLGVSLFILFFATSVFFVAPVLATTTGIVASSTTIEYPNPLETDEIIDIVERVADYFYYIAIALIPIMVIYTSILFFTAGGNDQQVAKARKTFIWLMIGVAVLLIGQGFITLIKDMLSVE